MPTEERCVPAAGRAWLTALYDPLMALTTRERALRPVLIAADSSMVFTPQAELEVLR